MTIRGPPWLSWPAGPNREAVFGLPAGNVVNETGWMMAESEPKKRRLLIVYEREDFPGTVVRGFQYKDLFEKNADFETRWKCRTKGIVDYCLQRVPKRFRVRRLFESAQEAICSRREKAITAAAAESDLVYLLTVPSYRLHHSLCTDLDVPVVFDFIDALWLPWFRQFGWNHLDEMLRISSGVICENEYVAKYADSLNQRVAIVPDSPQLDVFDARRDRVARDSERIVLGFVGGPNTVASLYSIWEPLEVLFSRYPQLHLRILGADDRHVPRFEQVRYSTVPAYDQQRMVGEILKMDIGLFPLFHGEESLARGNLKAKLYMCGEAVALCENYGTNRQLIQDGTNGMLAMGHEEWIAKLSYLIDNPDQRRAMARGGLETVRHGFSRAQCFEQLVSVLRSF